MTNEEKLNRVENSPLAKLLAVPEGNGNSSQNVISNQSTLTVKTIDLFGDIYAPETND